MREIPALYGIARQIMNEAGLTWYDPRTGKAYPPEPKRKPKVRIKRKVKGKR
jgi:hypothetical protein